MNPPGGPLLQDADRGRGDPAGELNLPDGPPPEASPAAAAEQPQKVNVGAGPGAGPQHGHPRLHPAPSRRLTRQGEGLEEEDAEVGAVGSHALFLFSF